MIISKLENEQRSTEENTILKSQFCYSIYIQFAYFVCELN